MTATAIAGLGLTAMGKVYGRTATDFAAEALALALADAGLEKSDVDGLLINANHSAEMGPMLQLSLGLEDLTLVSAMSAYGSSAGAMLQYATYAITSGQASVVACLYADAPLAPSPRPIGSPRPAGGIAESLRTLDERLAAASARGLSTGTVQQMGTSPLMFDPQGADFTAWINHFKNEVYRNWIVPPSVSMGARGQVSIEFVEGNIGVQRTLLDYIEERVSEAPEPVGPMSA